MVGSGPGGRVPAAAIVAPLRLRRAILNGSARIDRRTINALGTAPDEAPETLHNRAGAVGVTDVEGSPSLIFRRNDGVDPGMPIQDPTTLRSDVEKARSTRAMARESP